MALTPPLPPAKVSLLLSNFVLSTSRFLNSFAETADESLRKIGNKITDVETLMAVLEAKLGSVPDDDYVPAPAPAEAAAPGGGGEGGGGGGGGGTALDVNPAAATEVGGAEETTTALAVASNMIRRADHPDYAAFFKQMRIGAPLPAVQAKVSASGLDPEFLALDPEEMIEYDADGVE
jgi:hypothetical protein